MPANRHPHIPRRAVFPLAPIASVAALLWGLTWAGGCSETSDPGEAQKDAEVRADQRSAGGDARADLPVPAGDGPLADSAPVNDIPVGPPPPSEFGGPPPPPDLGPCTPRDQVCEPDKCGRLAGPISVCPPDGGGGILINRWCGECPDCADIRAQISAEIAVISACSDGDTCAADYSIPCGTSYRVGADLTAYEALAATYNQRCVDPLATWSCLELELICQGGHCF